MPKKGTAAAKVLPPKLPPRAAMSPAVNSFKGKNFTTNKKNLLNSSTQNASQGMMNVRPQLDASSKDNMYYPNDIKKEPSGLNSVQNSMN